MKKRPRALVIDDDPLWLDQSADLLEEQGYLVSKAATRKDAEHYLAIHAFILAVVDVNLTDAPVDEWGEPLDKQGLEIVADIRMYAKRDVAIVIVTGYGTRQITREAFKDLGVQDVLFKQDFDIAEFRSVIDEAVVDFYLRGTGFELGVESMSVS